MNIFEEAYQVYQREGQSGVETFAVSRGISPDTWVYCEPCENDEPSVDNTCLVCGTPNK